VSGSVTFDPDKPDSIKGKIVVTTESMHVPNPMMNEHLHSDKWMDATKFPDITFETLSIKNIKTDGNTSSGDITGKLTIKGTSKEITVPVKMTYLQGKLKARFPKLDGDLLVLRSNF